MKKLLLTIPALGLYLAAQAQNVGIGTTSPDASAMLEIRSTNKGLLIPRLALTGINDATTIPLPATGLMVFNTGAALPSGPGFYVNTGTAAAPMWAKMPTVYSSDAPVTGQSLIWNGTTYAPAYGTISANGTYFSGNGSPASPLNFNGVAINNTVLSGNGTTGSPLNVNTAAPVYNASQISSKPVNNTAPTNAQVLVYDAANNYYKPGPVNAVQIQSRNVSTTAPTNNQVLAYNTTTSQFEPKDDTWGTQSIVNTSGSVLSGNGTAASPLNVNTGSPVYNANKLYNSAISSTAPAANQVLVWDAVNNVYKPAPVNAAQIQNIDVSNTTPTSNQTLVFNSTTNKWEPKTVVDTWGNQVIVNTAGSVLSGNGTAASPLNVNTGANVYNANKLNNANLSSATPTGGQVLVFNSVTNQWEPISYTDSWGSQVIVNAPGSVLTGNGTAANPLNVTTTSPVYNASKIQSTDISTTAPTNNQSLVFNSTTNKWEPKTVALTDTWGSQVIVNAPGSVLSGNGTAASPLNVNTGANVYNANKINNISVVGSPADGQTLVYNSSNNTYTPADLSFSYSKCSSGGVAISQGNETGATPYTQNTAPGATIQPGSGSWTAIPGLSKTFTLSSAGNSIMFTTQGVVEYNGTLSSSGWVSYAIAIFVDGKLQATRIFTMTGSGGVDQFDTYQVTGQLENMSAGSHTIAVYGTRRNSPSNYGSNQDLYFCAPAPNYPNTNDFMNRGVLYINGSY